MAGPRRRRIVAGLLALGVGLVAVGCGDDDGGATSSTAPVPEGAGNTVVAALDLCEEVGDAPAAAFLAALGLGPVDEVQRKSTDDAAVCGWFVAPVGDATPEGVLARVEPLVADGNEVCRAAPEADASELSVGDATGWVTETGGRVQAATRTDAWCVYLRGPADVAPGPAPAADASAALLADVLSVLPPD